MYLNPISQGEYGPDLSHWQGKMNFKKSRAAGATLVYIKATDGIGFVDPRFKENWQAALGEGLKVGAYHYFRNDAGVDAQALNFLGTADYKNGILPPVLDVEDTKTKPIASDILRWLQIVEEAIGIQPVIYTGAWYWNRDRFGHGVTWASGYRLWVSSFNPYAAKIPEDWKRWWLWQFSGKGNGRGKYFGAGGADIDLNRAA